MQTYYQVKETPELKELLATVEQLKVRIDTDKPLQKECWAAISFFIARRLPGRLWRGEHHRLPPHRTSRRS